MTVYKFLPEAVEEMNVAARFWAGVRPECQFGRRPGCATIFGEVAMNFQQYITRNAVFVAARL